MQQFAPQKFGSPNNIPLISVVVPVGPIAQKISNLTEWIPQCSANYELVLVVDECGDSTHEFLTDFLLHTPTTAEITVLHGKFGGPGAARNEGLKLARGEWLIFWDADDIPNVQSAQNVASSTSREVDLIVCGYEIVSNVSRIKVETDNQAAFAFSPGLWRVIWKREVTKNQEFPNLLLGEDQVFLSRVLAKPRRIVFREEQIYTYIISQSDQLTSGTKNCEDLLLAANLVQGASSQGILHNIIELRLRLTYAKRSLKAGALAPKITHIKRSIRLLIQIAYYFLRRRVEQ